MAGREGDPRTFSSLARCTRIVLLWCGFGWASQLPMEKRTPNGKEEEEGSQAVGPDPAGPESTLAAL